MGKDDKHKARRQSVSHGSASKSRRERETERGHHESQYRPEDEDETLNLSSQPPAMQTGLSARTRPPASSQYSNQPQYTYQSHPISELTDQMANASITPLETQPEYNNPRAQAHLTTANPDTTKEEFDPNYKVHSSWEFKFGRVLKVLWSEPAGNGGEGGTVISERVTKRGKTSQEKIRRFVIIDTRKGHCICLSIMTYSGQGTTKKGVHADDHAIIYTSRPTLLRGEMPLSKQPIKVKPDTIEHKLDPASRLNYAKVYTIEHNVKVWFIGRIHRDDEWKLISAYNNDHPPIKQRFNESLHGPGQFSYPGISARSPQTDHFADQDSLSLSQHARSPGGLPPDPYASNLLAQSSMYEPQTPRRSYVDAQQSSTPAQETWQRPERPLQSSFYPHVATSSINTIQFSPYSNFGRTQGGSSYYSGGNVEYPSARQFSSGPYPQPSAGPSNLQGARAINNPDRYRDFYPNQELYDDNSLYDP